MKRLILMLLLAALVAAPALAGPTFKLRSDNAVVLRGVAIGDCAALNTAFGVYSFGLAVEGFPLDGPVPVVCDGVKDCERVRRGDTVLVKGTLRVKPEDGLFYVVAGDLDLKESGR